jgi:adenylylsulfate kinase
MSWAIWITGLPGSGKTTVALGVAQALRGRGIPVSVLELAAVRKALLGGRSETEHERDIVHRALAYTAKALTDAGVPVIVDATAPRREWREWARTLIPHFGEVQLLCPPEVCVTREQEGRWRRPSPEAAQTATLPEWVVDYEVSLRPELAVDTHAHEAWTVVDEVLRLAQRLQDIAAYHGREKERSHASP